MDRIWEFSNRKSLPIIFPSMILLYVIDSHFDSDVGKTILHLYILSFFLFIVIFYKSMHKGYDDLIKIYKPKAGVKFKFHLGKIFLLTLFILAIIGLFYGPSVFFWIYIATILIILIVAFLYSILQSNQLRISMKNYFVRMVLTESKFIVYSGLGRIFKFDRSALQFNFLSIDELVLFSTAADKHEKLVVNVSNLPIYEKQELRTLLGEETETLNRA